MLLLSLHGPKYCVIGEVEAASPCRFIEDSRIRASSAEVIGFNLSME